jgi:membrane fusion protein (multidrug efflux system)
MTIIRLLLLVGLLWNGGCARRNDGEPAAPAAAGAALAVPITVAPVTIRPSERVVSFVGTLYGNEEVTLSSQMEGQINAMAADLGDHVEATQVLAEINDDQLRARLREVEATLAKARADEARGRQLAERNVISPQEYESMKTAAAVVEAQRDTLTVLLQHSRVRSPLTGSVVKRLVSVGEYVRPGTPLFTLVADDPLKLRGDVPERFADELRPGQIVRVRVDAFPGASFEGQLARISPASNRENRSIAVEALIDNHDRQLKPGFFANAAIVTRSDEDAVMVPQEALITFAGVTKLFVIADHIAHERQVRPGARSAEGLIEIVEGLRADEFVATSGLTKLQNGASVTIRKPEDKRAQAG